MLLGLILAPGGQVQITYETFHKGWSVLWCSFLDASAHDTKRERDADMSETEGKHSYNEQRRLKQDPPPPESPYHRFMVVLKYYNFLTLTV